MMIAMCYYSSGNKAKAEIEFQKVIEKYPASPFAKRARARLAEK